MTDGLTLEISETASARFAAAPDVLRAGLATAADILQADLQARVAAKLSGDVVQRRTGGLVASISGAVHVGDDGVVASVGSDARQAGILEYGATLPARDILPSAGAVMRFGAGVGDIFAASVRFPGATIAPHSFLRSSLGDMQGEIEDRLGATVRDVLADRLG